MAIFFILSQTILAGNNCGRLSISVSALSNYNGYELSCTQPCNGKATVSYSSTNSNYFMIQWNNGPYIFNQSGIDTSANLCAGWQYVTVMDDSNYVCTDSIYFNQLPSNQIIPIDSVRITKIQYPSMGGCNGYLVGKVFGGTPPYLYQWYDFNKQPIAGATKDTLKNICDPFGSKKYYLKASDNLSFGCNSSLIDTGFIEVTIGAEMYATSMGFFGQVCDIGNSSASVELKNGFGGVAPFVIQINVTDGDSSYTLPSQTSYGAGFTLTFTKGNGNVIFTITDANGFSTSTPAYTGYYCTNQIVSGIGSPSIISQNIVSNGIYNVRMEVKINNPNNSLQGIFQLKKPGNNTPIRSNDNPIIAKGIDTVNFRFIGIDTGYYDLYISTCTYCDDIVRVAAQTDNTSDNDYHSAARTTSNQSILLGQVYVPEIVVTSIAANEKRSLMQLVPNPANNDVLIHTNVAGGRVIISNMLGETIYTTTTTSTQTNVSTSIWPNGIYFISLKTNDMNISTQKLVVSH